MVEEKKSYSELLKDPRWQKKRLEIMERDKFQCQYCFEKRDTLTVHHKYYMVGKKPWEYDNDCYVTLCDSHHKMFHNEFMTDWAESDPSVYPNFLPQKYKIQRFYDLNPTDVFLFNHWVEHLCFCDGIEGFKGGMKAIYDLTKKDNIYGEENL